MLVFFRKLVIIIINKNKHLSTINENKFSFHIKKIDLVCI